MFIQPNCFISSWLLVEKSKLPVTILAALFCIFCNSCSLVRSQESHTEMQWSKCGCMIDKKSVDNRCLGNVKLSRPKRPSFGASFLKDV